MNKQEAIEKIKNIETLNINDMIAGQQVDMVIKNQVLDIVSKIDEPQKVVVPKFVAEWLEECKRSGWHLQKALCRLDDDEKVGDWAYDENDDLVSEKVDMIARAWLDGYEIEQEKLYTVEIPNPNGVVVCLERLDRGKIALSTLGESELTEAEIKQDFDWAWKWAKPVEICVHPVSDWADELKEVENDTEI